jgi:hypothetical protein
MVFGIHIGLSLWRINSGCGTLKKMRAVMRMAAIIKIRSIALAVVIAVASSYCRAEEHYPTVDICYLLKNIDSYRGKVVTLRSDIRFTAHGMHLFGEQCSGEGDIGLNISDEQYKDKKVASFIKKVFHQSARASITIVGYAVPESSGHWKGYFILQDILGVNKP